MRIITTDEADDPEGYAWGDLARATRPAEQAAWDFVAFCGLVHVPSNPQRDPWDS